jgi:magnesium chelatase accessory protein
MLDAPRWDQEGRDWPNRDSSQFIEAGGVHFHVQIMGRGPIALLLHGTGAATHSWRDLAPILAQHFTVIAPDLPGHGFSSLPAPPGLSLPGMAKSIAALLRKLGMSPALGVGHSAGAAILARMCLNDTIAPSALVSLNGAFVPLPGLTAQLFSPLAKLMARIPVVPHLFAWHVGDPRVVEKLMRSTGSVIDPAGMTFYARLMRRPRHPAAALGMMANWDLPALHRDLARLKPALLLIVGNNDRTIPPADARRIARLVPGATVTALPGLGHLAHEESPAEIATLIEHFAQRSGILVPA